MRWTMRPAKGGSGTLAIKSKQSKVAKRTILYVDPRVATEEKVRVLHSQQNDRAPNLIADKMAEVRGPSTRPFVAYVGTPKWSPYACA